MTTEEEYREIDLQLGEALSMLKASQAICPVAEAVREKIKGRALVGQEKYGVDMMRSDLDLHDWLRLAQEEAMDLAVYLERIQIILKKEPKRLWVGLTNEEVRKCYAHVESVTVSEAVILMSVVRITQAMLKGKNS
jgi:hypothetical protein